MEQFVDFVCGLVWAGALFLSTAIINPEMRDEETGGARGVVAQNKAPAAFGCPITRYPVRFGRDSDVNLIDLATFTRTTIETMRSWPTPAVIPPEKRIWPYETAVLALEATLVEFRKERDADGSDYRLVLADGSGRTIIAKISFPDCGAQEDDEPGGQLPPSRFLEGIGSARAEFDAWRVPKTTPERANVQVRIAGIGMFDVLSRQAGEAPNGIQICPVLSLSFVTGRMAVIPVPGSRHPQIGGVRR